MHDDVWFVSPEEHHARLFQTTVCLKHYGSEWLEGAAFHLWHPANRNNPHDKDNVRNHMILNKIQIRSCSILAV